MLGMPFGCPYPGCGRAGRTRGCCASHYKLLLDRVRAGQTTWARLEAEGLCRPPRPRVHLYRPARGPRGA